MSFMNILDTLENETLIESLEDLKNNPIKLSWLDKVVTVLKRNKPIKGASCCLFADFAVESVENNLINSAFQVISKKAQRCKESTFIFNETG